jgi:pimeloyl-ACP methyl ester carboxylesterase
VPFLLVHGLASNARMWDGVAAVLAEAGHDVAAVDLRGHGQSPKPDEGYDFGSVVDDLLAVLDRLGWERAVAAGQSWGGNVVLELALRSPERVHAAACVDGGTIELSRRFESWEDCAEALRPPPLAGPPMVDIEGMVRGRHHDWPESGVIGMLANFEVRADGTVAPWLTRERHMQILHHLWEHRPSLVYADVAVPLLFIPAGDKAETSAAAAAAPRGRVAVLEGDHDLHAQQPEAVARLLLELAS